MLAVRSVFILHGRGIKIWMCLCVERGSCLGVGNRVGMRKIRKNIVRQKKTTRK